MRISALVLAPRVRRESLFLPMGAAAVSLTVWFVACEIGVRKPHATSVLATPIRDL